MSDEQKLHITRHDVEGLIEVRKSLAYLVNETSDGRHHRGVLPIIDALLNRLVGYEVYDVPLENDDEAPSSP